MKIFEADEDFEKPTINVADYVCKFLKQISEKLREKFLKFY